jgi:RNA polymerase sigma-70 factor (ECF subfamily)
MFEDDVIAGIPRLRGYARKLTRNLVDADDLLQSTILKALSKKHLFKPGSNVRAWMFTIMHNLRASDVRRSANHSFLLEGNDPFPTRNSDPEVQLLMRDVVEELGLLAPSTRRIIEGITAGMSYDEIGRRENVPIGTVRSRLSRGRASCANLLSDNACADPGCVTLSVLR